MTKIRITKGMRRALACATGTRGQARLCGKLDPEDER
jgi:hypothetical protein